MIKNLNRIGRFTSSKIYLLAANGTDKSGFSAGALTYIRQRGYERLLGRSIDTGRYSQEMAWGKLMEHFAYSELGLEYSRVSLETLKHKRFDYWSGSPDLIVAGKKVAEVKCYYPENFAKFASALFLADIEKLKKDCPKEYWQIVSNAIIVASNERPGTILKGEGIAYMPRLSTLVNIREQIEKTDLIEKVMQDEPWKYRFIVEKELEELPYLPDEVKFPNLVRFEFDIPTEDIIFLTKRVKAAEELLTAA